MSSGMNIITKNRQGIKTLETIAQAAFGKNETLLSYKEFPEGFCNVTYRLDLSSGRSVVLKVAAPPHTQMMSCEAALMETEVRAMKEAAKHHIEKVPKIYFYDCSKTICSGDYFLMEMLQGKSYDKAKQNMGQEQQEKTEIQIGQWLKKLHDIKGSRFGHFFREDLQRNSWYDAFRFMLEQIVGDGIEKEVDILISPQELFQKLERDQSCIDEVREPRMIHFDSWDGNVFVEEGRVIGLIDWERAMWADGLMEERFRFHNANPGLLKGYGKKEFTENESIRCRWYDVYLYLMMMIEGAYRHYEDNGQYQWTSDLLKQVWKKING